jgi:hypothetical protein
VGKKICEHNFPKSLDGDFDEKYPFTTFDYPWEAPLAIDVLVKFNEGGDITFGGAGVRFEVETPDWVGTRSRDAACLETYVRRA